MQKTNEFIFEVCANGLTSLLSAQKAGATRAELCQAIEIGGLTPSYACLKLAAAQKTIPVHVLIRCRAGHYVYSNLEKLQMLEDIKLVKSLGFEGVVVGALLEDGGIDMDYLKEVKKLSSGLHLTFHRAIDAACDPLSSLGILVELGFDTVLTSGAEPTALQGVELLQEMQQGYGNQIRIMAGGGINAQNARTIAEETGVKALHFSAKTKMQLQEIYPQGIDVTEADMTFSATDAELVKAIIRGVQAD
ncbi:MAG: copper homeostasis protein CutC [Bacteroidales bacterium]|nr:copper homeostasis protein CutC [Bacteroidales bacterium]